MNTNLITKTPSNPENRIIKSAWLGKKITKPPSNNYRDVSGQLNAEIMKYLQESLIANKNRPQTTEGKMRKKLNFTNSKASENENTITMLDNGILSYLEISKLKMNSQMIERPPSRHKSPKNGEFK